MNTEFISKVRRIAVVDDNDANRAAAIEALSRKLPRCTVIEFANAVDAVGYIMTSTDVSLLPDLVFSDMAMENSRSGCEVLAAAWSWRIPATIVSGGIRGHGTDRVKLGYPVHLFEGEKDSPDIWEMVIEEALSGDAVHNVLLTALKFGKLTSPDTETGGGDRCGGCSRCPS